MKSNVAIEVTLHTLLIHTIHGGGLSAPDVLYPVKGRQCPSDRNQGGPQSQSKRDGKKIPARSMT
jgi:hypothetical protein